MLLHDAEALSVFLTCAAFISTWGGSTERCSGNKASPAGIRVHAVPRYTFMFGWTQFSLFGSQQQRERPEGATSKLEDSQDHLVSCCWSDDLCVVGFCVWVCVLDECVSSMWLSLLSETDAHTDTEPETGQAAKPIRRLLNANLLLQIFNKRPALENQITSQLPADNVLKAFQLKRPPPHPLTEYYSHFEGPDLP